MKIKEAIDMILKREHMKRANELGHALNVDPTYVYRWRKGVEPLLPNVLKLIDKYPYVKKLLLER